MPDVPRLARVLARTLVHAVPTVIGIVILDFFLLRLAPGDAADVLAGESGAATEETVAALRSRFGLDLPVFEQLLAYLNNLAHLSLSFSPRYNMPVGDLILQRLPGTLVLMAVALALALALGINLGVLMATLAGRWPDRVLSVVALLFYSIPSFWIGLMLIVLLSVKLRWLPSGGSARWRTARPSPATTPNFRPTRTSEPLHADSFRAPPHRDHRRRLCRRRDGDQADRYAAGTAGPRDRRACARDRPRHRQ